MTTKVFWLAALLIPLATAVADDRPLTLEEAVDQALLNAPEIAASVANVDAAQAVAPSTGRLPDPELALAVDNLPINSADRFSFSRDFMTMRRVGLMQSFPSRAKRRLQSEHARQEIGVAEAELRRTRFETARAASDAWIARAVADASIARLRALKPDVELEASAARAALASGRTSAADALAAQTLGARLDDRLLALNQEVEMRTAELARWVGDAANRPSAPMPTDRALGGPMEHLITNVSEHAPLAPLVAQLAAARTDVELARAEKRPDWSAELSYQKRGSDFSDMVSLEFRVGLPVFTKHRQSPVIAEKLATVRAQEAERDAEIRMHTAEIGAALAEWRQGRKRLEHYDAELLPLAHDQSRAAIAGYGAGRADLRAAIDALTGEIDTQLDYVELQGTVSRTWTFLHLLHDSGATP
jgi:outer membrane protein, heavy metal efflux system